MTDVDPGVEEVREIRHRISEQLQHDPAKIVEYYRRLQEQYRERLLSEEGEAGKPGRPAA